MVDVKFIIVFLAIAILLLIFYNVVYEIKENYSKDDPMLDELLKAIRPIFETNEKYTGNLAVLNETNILNKISLHKGEKSYTINKEKVYLCLRDEKNEYYNRNMLIYVLLHELAHVICDEIGHTEKFHDIFQNLLLRAINEGVYNPSIPVIQNYCNHTE